MLRKTLPHILLLGISLTLIPKIGLGQVYQEVKIGTQKWMPINLNSSTFRNGDTIPQARTVEEWKAAGKNKQPAWCYYENDTTNGTRFGKLYNWYALNDNRGIAPVGWHVPSIEEWSSFAKSLEGMDIPTVFNEITIIQMKSEVGWINDGNGTNNSNFNALPGGCRTENGSFEDIWSYTSWWSSTVDDYYEESAYIVKIDCFNWGGTRVSSKKSGKYIRCIKD